MKSFLRFTIFMLCAAWLIGGLLAIIALLQGYTAEAKLCAITALCSSALMWLCIKILEDIEGHFENKP